MAVRVNSMRKSSSKLVCLNLPPHGILFRVRPGDIQGQPQQDQVLRARLPY